MKQNELNPCSLTMFKKMFPYIYTPYLVSRAETDILKYHLGVCCLEGEG